MDNHAAVYDPGKLRDNDLELVLVEKYPGDATIGCPHTGLR